MAALGLPHPFRSSTQDLYVVAYDPAGAWVAKDGRPCHLLSVNIMGSPRRIVQPGTEDPGDREAIRHFDLAQWLYTGLPDRRRSNPAANWAGPERREDDRRAGDRRQSDRRALEPPQPQAPERDQLLVDRTRLDRRQAGRRGSSEPAR